MNKKSSQESCLNSGEGMNSKLYDYIKIFHTHHIEFSFPMKMFAFHGSLMGKDNVVQGSYLQF